MPKPKYGWSDLAMRVAAGAQILLASTNTVAGQPLWALGWSASALGLIACISVDRLRQDIRFSQRGQVRVAQDQGVG